MVEFRIDIFVSLELYRLIELLVSLAKGQRGTSDLSRERTGVSRAFFHPVLASASHLNWCYSCDSSPARQDSGWFGGI